MSSDLVRINEILQYVERLVGGETHVRIPLSERRDPFDALAFGVNAIAQELVFHKEAAEAANLAKTRFLAHMSHEIRTPLSVVLGLCELLRDPGLPQSDREDAIEKIRLNGDMLQGLVDNVLDLAKIESGKTELRREWVNPAALLQTVVRSLEPKAREKGLVLQAVIGRGVRARIHSDPLRVKQILTNLIANSIKFTTFGKVTASLDQPGENLEFTVSDTGIGISEDKQTLLFEPYRQAGEGIGSRFGGTGLGLALGRRFARLLEGTLELRESTPGKGSTFVLKLPAGELSEAPLPASGLPESAGMQGRLRGLKVLLAEDSPELRGIYRNFLEREGASVALAADGVEAVEQAGACAFDLLLMDVNMPRLGGIEATRRLRKSGFQAPIVALTAHALGIHEAECRAAGYNGSLSKPFYPDTLTETVIRALGREQ